MRPVLVLIPRVFGLIDGQLEVIGKQYLAYLVSCNRDYCGALDKPPSPLLFEIFAV